MARTVLLPAVAAAPQAPTEQGAQVVALFREAAMAAAVVVDLGVH